MFCFDFLFLFGGVCFVWFFVVVGFFFSLFHCKFMKLKSKIRNFGLLNSFQNGKTICISLPSYTISVTCMTRTTMVEFCLARNHSFELSLYFRSRYLPDSVRVPQQEPPAWFSCQAKGRCLCRGCVCY